MRYLAFIAALAIALIIASARAQGSIPVSIAADLDPDSATGMRVEGLAADREGRLYTVDFDSARLFRVTPSNGTVEVLATLPRPASGMAFDRDGNLYMASGDVVLRIAAGRLGATPFDPAADVQTYATGVPGANGLAFDGAGNLYVSGGATGTIYVVGADRAARTFVNGLVSDRPEQPISTNGLQFAADGRLYSANTGTGAIDRIVVNPDGTAGTVERFVADRLLLGADGIAFAANGDLYVAANERNAIVKVTSDGQVSDVAGNGNAGPLEFPTSPAFVGTSLYISNFDIPRGANAPGDAGVGASIARVDLGVEGLPLPVGAAAPAAPTSTTTPAIPETTVTPTESTDLITPVTPTESTDLITPTTSTDLITATATVEQPPPDATPTPDMFGEQPTPTTVIDIAPEFPVPLPATPLPAGGAIRLPDTGAEDAAPWLPLAIVAILALAAGLAVGRRRRASR